MKKIVMLVALIGFGLSSVCGQDIIINQYNNGNTKQPVKQKNVMCYEDGQLLWNNCFAKRACSSCNFYIYDINGNQIVGGYSIELLWNGCYKVQVCSSCDFYIYNANGEQIVGGYSIELLENGCYKVKVCSSCDLRIYNANGKLIN